MLIKDKIYYEEIITFLRSVTIKNVYLASMSKIRHEEYIQSELRKGKKGSYWYEKYGKHDHVGNNSDGDKHDDCYSTISIEPIDIPYYRKSI